MESTSPTFPKTRWTLIQKVRSGSLSERDDALNQLCAAYWFPLYAFARKTGLPQQEAEDAVQAFMLNVLNSDLFGSADQNRGHLRTLLLNRFSAELINRHRHDHRQKRGGGVLHIPLSLPDAEGRYQLEIASSDAPPDVIFHRQWAENLLQRSMSRLCLRFQKQGLGDRFEILRAHIPWNGGPEDSTAAAAAAGMTPAAFRTALHRTRNAYRQILIDEVRQTLGSDDPELIQNEIRELFQVLSR